MQRGVPIWEAAGFLGMSPEVLQDTYGHHHPDHLHGAALAIGQKGRYVSVADLTEDRNEKKKPNDIWSEWQDLNLRPLRPERNRPPLTLSNFNDLKRLRTTEQNAKTSMI